MGEKKNVCKLETRNVGADVVKGHTEGFLSVDDYTRCPFSTFDSMNGRGGVSPSVRKRLVQTGKCSAHIVI